MNVDEVLAKFTPDEGSFVPADVAAEVRVWLEHNDPDTLRAWLWECRQAILTDHLQHRLTRERSRTLRRARARAFGRAASTFESGDVEPLSMFAVVFAVDEDNTRRRVADMRGADHLFVAGRYEGDGRGALLLAEFHRQVAAKVGRRRTGDVLDEATYEKLYTSIVRPAA